MLGAYLSVASGNATLPGITTTDIAPGHDAADGDLQTRG
jgi:hypothetical protein